MKIVCSELYVSQLKAILEEMVEYDFKATKSFKSYLDTIILNVPTKSKKYKKSILFDDENIKDIEHQGLRIPFMIDETNDVYVILGVTKID
jgi:hypothetical protein